MDRSWNLCRSTTYGYRYCRSGDLQLSDKQISRTTEPEPEVEEPRTTQVRTIPEPHAFRLRSTVQVQIQVLYCVGRIAGNRLHTPVFKPADEQRHRPLDSTHDESTKFSRSDSAFVLPVVAAATRIYASSFYITLPIAMMSRCQGQEQAQ